MKPPDLSTAKALGGERRRGARAEHIVASSSYLSGYGSFVTCAADESVGVVQVELQAGWPGPLGSSVTGFDAADRDAHFSAAA